MLKKLLVIAAVSVGVLYLYNHITEKDVHQAVNKTARVFHAAKAEMDSDMGTADHSKSKDLFDPYAKK